jgi:hypothetical protein
MIVKLTTPIERRRVLGAELEVKLPTPKSNDPLEAIWLDSKDEKVELAITDCRWST